MDINIYERKASKIPEQFSIFLDCNEFYDKEIFDRIIQMQNSVYNTAKNEFEIPLNGLSYLVRVLTKKYSVILHFDKTIEDKHKQCSKDFFKVKPFQHQIEAIDYGLSKKNWMLLDDCGLGKTLSMIYLAEELSRTEGLEHCFIVCGVNSLKYNWANEIEKFSNKSYTILGQVTTKKGKKKIVSVPERCKKLKNGIDEFFIITNVETLQSKDFAQSFNKSKSKFGMIVVDEAHHCNNPNTLSGKTLLKLKSDRKIALTGTVIMNNPENAYVPLKWTSNIGCGLTDFKNMFLVKGGFGGVQVIGYKNLDILKDLIKSCSLRRKKEDVLDLPEKSYVIDYVEMGKQQKDLYSEVEEGIMKELDLLDHIPTIMEELTINLRLRQITAFPGALSTEVTQSAKLDRAKELVEEITSQGDKVVIFNTFKSSAYELGNRLSDFGAVVCTGDQSDSEIADIKTKFETDENCKVLVATWQKLGTGHTLTSANYCIFVDTPWTDADFKQACDRIYRIGQRKNATIITLITKDTYDERVLEILNKKESLSNYLIDDGNSESVIGLIE